MRDPLLGPVAAIAAGILAARFVPFRSAELILVIAAFLALGVAAMARRARVLAGICCLLGFVAAGALTALAHRPGPAPQLVRFPALLSTGMLGTEQCIEKSWVLRRSAPLRPISLPQD